MTKRIEREDLYRLKFLQSGVFSPDGSAIAYTVLHTDTTDDKEYTTLWLLDVASGQARQMTAGKAREASPRWSPDGKQIAFISDRGGKPQVYVLPVDGGEARRVTEAKQGVGGALAWSPDGAKLAFTAGVDYGDATPPDLSKDAYRVSRHVYRFDAIGYLDQAVTNVYVIDVAGGEPQRLTDDPCMNGGDLAWLPDGDQIVYTASMQPDVFNVFFPRVRVVNMQGESRDLLTGWEIGRATPTPDGKRLLIVGRPNDEKPIGTKSDLWVMDMASGALSNRTPSLAVGVGGGLGGDMPVVSLATIFLPLSEDGQHVYIRVQDGGTVQIYRVALDGEESWAPVISGERTCLPLDLKDGKLLYSVDHINATPDLYIASADGSGEQRLTDLNAAFFAEVSLPTWEHLLFPGTDGTQVEGWFVRPPVGEAPFPTILYIHGGPHAAYGHRFFFDFQMLAGAGYGVLFINHRASTGYGDAFSTAIKGDWGNLDYGDLMAGVDEAIKRGLADPDRLGCCGTSGGGNLSCWIVGQTDRFKAAVPQNPVTNWVSFYGVSDIGVWFAVEELGGHPHEIPEVYAKCSPLTYAHRCKTPTLLVQSEHDWRCPAEQSEQFYTVLKASGCIVEMLRQPAGSHGASFSGPVPLKRAHDIALLDWFDRYVKG